MFMCLVVWFCAHHQQKQSIKWNSPLQTMHQWCYSSISSICYHPDWVEGIMLRNPLIIWLTGTFQSIKPVAPRLCIGTSISNHNDGVIPVGGDQGLLVGEISQLKFHELFSFLSFECVCRSVLAIILLIWGNDMGEEEKWRGAPVSCLYWREGNVGGKKHVTSLPFIAHTDGKYRNSRLGWWEKEGKMWEEKHGTRCLFSPNEPAEPTIWSQNLAA